MLIGLTGYMGSGKGSVSDYMKKLGFEYTSLSNVVRKEALTRGLEHTRENLQNVGNELRDKFGSDVLAKRVSEEICDAKTPKHWVIDGVRNPAEVEYLRKLDGWNLISIEASDETIVQHLLERGRDNEKELSREQILAKLERERGVGESKSGQQIEKCMQLADYSVINDGTFAKLEEKLNHILGEISGIERPSFDEIFMGIAYIWAKRATCLRRQVGAVIAKDKQQLTAGYNGAPRGLPHCAELGGCLREKLKIPSGQRHELCRGTHAEQNAITQAAKFGINIEGGVLYCNTYPCVICAKMILNAGLTKVVYDSNYNDPLSRELLSSQKVVKIVKYEGKKYK